MKHSSEELAAAKYNLRVNIRFVFILIYACHGRVYSPNPPWTATVIGYVIGRSASITDVLSLSLSQLTARRTSTSMRTQVLIGFVKRLWGA